MGICCALSKSEQSKSLVNLTAEIEKILMQSKDLLDQKLLVCIHGIEKIQISRDDWQKLLEMFINFREFFQLVFSFENIDDGDHLLNQKIRDEMNFVHNRMDCQVDS